jgi:hypothetical protein
MNKYWTFAPISFGLVFAILAGCASGPQKSIPAQAAELTKEALSYDGCPYGVVEGSEKMGTKTDSRYEYYHNSHARTGPVSEFRFMQRGYSDVTCAKKPKKATGEGAVELKKAEGGAKAKKAEAEAGTK